MYIDKKFRRICRAHDQLCVHTNYNERGTHLVQRTKGRKRLVAGVRNAIRQAAYMPSPPKGFRYTRDLGQSGMVPMLVRL